MKSARPLGDIGTWVTIDDYPAEALQAGQEGTVSFRLTIDRSGSVAQCAITQGSGFPALDDRTCALLTERARFTPARNAAGAPAEGVYSSRVRWLLPLEPISQAPALIPIGNPGAWATDLDYPRKSAKESREGDVDFSLLLGVSGRPVRCTIVRSSGFPDLDEQACALMMKRARFRLAGSANGSLDGATWTSTVHWKRPGR